MNLESLVASVEAAFITKARIGRLALRQCLDAHDFCHGAAGEWREDPCPLVEARLRTLRSRLLNEPLRRAVRYCGSLFRQELYWLYLALVKRCGLYRDAAWLVIEHAYPPHERRLLHAHLSAACESSVRVHGYLYRGRERPTFDATS